jgi:phospholipid-translocating ATPase
VPVIVIVTITAIKDAIEDYRRTVLDLELNNTPTQILAYNHNYNVTDDNISLWRRIKKATSRLVFRVARMIKQKQQARKKKKNNDVTINDDDDKSSPFDNQLTRATTIYSVYSVNEQEEGDDGGNNSYSMSELQKTSSGKRLDNPFEPEGEEEDDFSRTVLDHVHGTPGRAKFRRDFWKNVRVGDFVRIRNNDEIPADVLILATSDSDGACYVETKNLDGETNLKVRQALKCGEGIKHSSDCEKAKFWIESEPPQQNLYSYNGVARWYPHDMDPDSVTDEDIRAEPATINNLLLRGCSLRNTDWVIGVVVFTGSETKIMLNAGVTPTKRSQISRELNFSVICNFVLLFILCLISGIINGLAFAKDNSSISFFEYGSIGGSAPLDGLVTFWASLILYQSLVPISLYISIEIVKTVQAFFIYSDCFMYYEPIDYPCTPKSWNISDDLGQVEYVFSDKTGTLTQNVMEFKKCSINGMAYGKAYTEALAGLRKRDGVDVDEEGQRMRAEIASDKAAMVKNLRTIHDNPQMFDDDVTFVSSQFVKDVMGENGTEQQEACKHFMLVLALCHSVIVEESETTPGRLEFKAQSPDEAALVATARDMGFTFVERTQKGVVLDVQGTRREYQILNTLEFNSTRKRMSAIVKFKDYNTGEERIVLLCKGADSIIYSRLRPNEQEQLRQETALHLEQFAQEGLRTLCLAERELSPQEYNDWNERHELASAAITNREEQMEEVADSIEREMTLIGGTAIEDRLQDGVPSSIALLGDAGIKLWVLTGDKVETAINIGFSCNLLDNGMELLIVRVEDNTKASAEKMIMDYLNRYFGMTGSDEELEMAKKDHSPPSPQYAVVIDGDSLKLALDDDLKAKFLLLCKQCKSVLCCRVSPAQKAAVVRLVKQSLGVMTLSIGDGANDVSMIQEANVGVGIAGEEGRQAVMSSDYAIGQFRFLTRLLLVHGRWSYKRLAEMIPNFFYKNVVFTLTLFWYGIFSDFDGAYLFEYTYVMFFNLAFTSLPVIVMGVLDQDADDRICVAVPQLYRRGILRLEWTQKKFWVYMVDGVYQSFISFFFPYFCYYLGNFESSNGLAVNHRYWIGLAVCSIAVMSCNIYVISNQYRWDWFSLLIATLSCLFLYMWTGIYSSVVYSKDMYKMASEMFGTCIYWAVIVVGIVAALLPHYTYLAMQKLFYPLDVDLIREKWYMGEFDYLPPTGEENNEKYKLATQQQQHQQRKECYSPDGSPASETTLNNSSVDSQKDKKRNSKRISSAMSWMKRTPPAQNDNFGDQQGLVSHRSQEDPSLLFVDERDYDTESNSSIFGMQPVDSNVSGSNKDTRTFHSAESHRTLDPRVPPQQPPPSLPPQHQTSQQHGRSSLDQVRHSLRMEQARPRESLDSVRTSMDLKDVTTAEGLMKSISRDI